MKLFSKLFGRGVTPKYFNAREEIIDFLLPLMIEYRDKTQSYPANMTEDQWNEVLDKIINGLRAGKNYLATDNKQALPAFYQAMDLLRVYMFDLWS